MRSLGKTPMSLSEVVALWKNAPIASNAFKRPGLQPKKKGAGFAMVMW
jgi:hypothetical protein